MMWIGLFLVMFGSVFFGSGTSLAFSAYLDKKSIMNRYGYHNGADEFLEISRKNFLGGVVLALTGLLMLAFFLVLL